MCGSVRLRLIAVETACPLVGDDGGDEPHHQRRHEHQHHERDDEGDALLASRNRFLFLSDSACMILPQRYRSTNARLRRLTCVTSVLCANCAVARSRCRERPVNAIFTLRIWFGEQTSGEHLPVPSRSASSIRTLLAVVDTVREVIRDLQALDVEGDNGAKRVVERRRMPVVHPANETRTTQIGRRRPCSS